MYIHLSNNVVCEKKKIIGFFDMDTATVSPITAKFLRDGEKENRVEFAGYEIPKTFVVLSDNQIKLTKPSPASLAGRFENDYKTGEK